MTPSTDGLWAVLGIAIVAYLVVREIHFWSK